MTQPIIDRQSLSIALVVALQAVVPPLIAVGNLYFLCNLFEADFDSRFVALSAIVAGLTIVLMQAPRYMSSQIITTRTSLYLALLGRWCVLLGILFVIGYASKLSSHFSRQVMFVWAMSTPAAIILAVGALHEVMRFLTLSASDARRAVFAGCNEVSLSFAQRLKANPDARIASVGFFDDRGLDRLGIADDGTVELLGRLPDLAAYVKANDIDVIFVALPMRHIQRVINLLDDLRDTTASIYYVPDIFVYDLVQARTGEIVGMPVVAMCETPFYGYRGIVKRLTDIVLAGGAVLFLAPVMLFVATLVKLSSPGPVIFRQRRYGLAGEEIQVFKFRTMTVLEDGARVTQATKDDDRFTPIGRVLRRTSLDELPQFFNVLRGDMSLVGPRPHAVAHNEQYRKLIKGYMIRHKVRPGITGLAQVSGCRGETAQIEEMEARVRFDLEYLRRWTPMLDIQILWRTVLLVFRRDEKAY